MGRACEAPCFCDWSSARDPVGASAAASAELPVLSAPMGDAWHASWSRVPGVRLGRRSVSPRRGAEATTDVVCNPVSWDDADSSRLSGWAHNATLTDPCFHHPRSSFSRSINTTIAEDDAQFSCGPLMEAATGNRRRPPRETVQDLPLHPSESESQHVMFRMDEELQLPPDKGSPPPVRNLLESAPSQDYEEEGEDADHCCSVAALPIPVGTRRGKQDAAAPHSPVFTPSRRDLEADG